MSDERRAALLTVSLESLKLLFQIPVGTKFHSAHVTQDDIAKNTVTFVLEGSGLPDQYVCKEGERLLDICPVFLDKLRISGSVTTVDWENA